MSTTTITNLPIMLKRLATEDFIVIPAEDFLRDWSQDLLKETQMRAPHWRNEVAESFETEVHGGIWARVFSDYMVARWSEMGTGALSTDPNSSHEPYFPPPAALRDWSEDHGLDPYSVAYGIFRAGGTKPRGYFAAAEGVIESSMSGRLSRFGKAIEHQAGIVP